MEFDRILYGQELILVEHKATYFYCDVAEELYMDENQMRENDFAMKDKLGKMTKDLQI